MYIEHKTDQNDRGEAWIGLVEFSKSGQTVYFNGKAYKKLKSGGISGNFYDIGSGDEFWIQGLRRMGKIDIGLVVAKSRLNEQLLTNT